MSAPSPAAGPTVPYAWVDKRMVARIMKESSNRSSAVTAYLALAITASDKKLGTFTATHAAIGDACGLPVRTLQRVLPELVRVGAITMSTPRLKAPSTYKLIPFDDQSPCNPDGSRALRQGGGTISQGGKAIRQRVATSVADISKNIRRSSLPIPKEVLD